MTHFFISYAKADTQATAFALADALSARPDTTVWVDRELTALGSGWSTQIQTNIDDCDYFIVLLSPDVNRKPGSQKAASFVLNEIAYMIQKYNGNADRIIPVMVQQTPLPLEISSKQYIDWTKGNDINKLVVLIAKTVSTIEAPQQVDEPVIQQPIKPHNKRPLYLVASSALVVVVLVILAVILSKGDQSGVEAANVSTKTATAITASTIPPTASPVVPTDQDTKVVTADGLVDPPPITGSVITVAYSPDGMRLASDGCDVQDSDKNCLTNDFRLWDIASGKLIVPPVKDQKGYIYYLTYSPDGKLIATGGDDQTIHLRDASTGKTLTVLTGHTNNVLGLAFSPDSKLLASASADRTVRLWDVASGQMQGQPIKGATDWVRTVAFSPDGKMLAFAGDDKIIRLWDVAAAKLLTQQLIGHTDSVNDIAFSADGKFLASASFDRTVRLWDVATGNQINILKGFTGWVLSVAVSPDSTTIAAGGCAKQVQTTVNHYTCTEGDLRLFNLSTGASQIFTDHSSWTEAIAFSPDGKFLASGSADRTINLWNLQDTPLSKVTWGH